MQEAGSYRLWHRQGVLVLHGLKLLTSGLGKLGCFKQRSAGNGTFVICLITADDKIVRDVDVLAPGSGAVE
jgi:hypothetical protein